MTRRGFVLVTALTMLVVLMALLTAYFALTRIEVSTTRSVADSTTGLYAAEAGLNLRAEQVKGMFQNYGLPTAVGEPAQLSDCLTSYSDSTRLDFGCQRLVNVQNRNVYTFLKSENGGQPVPGRNSPGQSFAGLNYQQYSYTLTSAAYPPNNDNRPEAILKMGFRVKYIPMFQFAAFFDDDLEIHPGPPMTLRGPVHTNSNLYLSAANGNPSSNTLEIQGQVSAVGSLYRGRKDGDPEQASTPCSGEVRVSISGSSNLAALVPSDGSSGNCPDQLATNLAAYNGGIRAANGPDGLRVNNVQIPKADFLDPVSGYTYWDKAELRMVLNLPNPASAATVNNIEIRTSANTLMASATSALRSSCAGSILSRSAGASNSFYNMREGSNDRAKLMQFLEVDMQGLLSCVQANSLAFGFNLNDTSDGGLVFYFSVQGPDSGVGCVRTNTSNNCPINNYGVRIRNGSDLTSAGNISGMTVVTNQALYVQGDYNSVNKKPAAFLSDSLNILSNAWLDDGTAADLFKGEVFNRVANLGNDGAVAADTTINAAFLSGVDQTGSGSGNGGLQNYPRFHENWDGRRFNYRGSFVSLDHPRYVNGPFGQTSNRPGQRYNPPIRNWDYDTDFNDPAKLPPLTPRAVVLEQESFTRDFER